MEWLHARVVRDSQKALAKKNRIKSLQIIIIIIIIIDTLSTSDVLPHYIVYPRHPVTASIANSVVIADSVNRTNVCVIIAAAVIVGEDLILCYYETAICQLSLA